MIERPNILLVGAFEKHSGKTTLSEEIVRKFNKLNICALKITVFRENKFEKGWSITEELLCDTEKDTRRLKLAGAKTVLWLRTDESCAEKAISEAVSRFSSDTPLICESNMARKFIKPALFIMVKRDVLSSMKKTASEVAALADMVVVSSLNNNKINYLPNIPNMIEWEDKKWVLKEK